MWQDAVIVGIQVILIIALVPTLLHPNQKPTVSTSLMNFVPLIILSITYLTLELIGSAIAGTILALEWGFLAYQRYRLNKKASGF